MKLKNVIAILLLLVACNFQKARSQSHIALSSGFSSDINNVKPFYHVPVSIRLEPLENYRFFIETIYSIPLPRAGFGEAYTLNPLLPDHIKLKKVINAYLFTVNLGGEILCFTSKKNNAFYLDLSAGICSQHFKVNYKGYDKVNYEVLNPDISTDSSGPVLSIAGIYSFHKRKQDMFVKLSVQTPPLVLNTNISAESYKLIAPLQLIFGYKLFYRKRKK